MRIFIQSFDDLMKSLSKPKVFVPKFNLIKEKNEVS